MIKIGLTGEIGMGKSTVAKMFAEHDIPIWDADLAAHACYNVGSPAVGAVGLLYPDAMVNGKIDRKILSNIIHSDPQQFDVIKEVLAPFLLEDMKSFTARMSLDHTAALYDVPLLFEYKMQFEFDTIVIVDCSFEIQRERVLGRQGMTEQKFMAVKSKQIDNSLKRTWADHVIKTDRPLADMRMDVQKVLDSLALNI